MVVAREAEVRAAGAIEPEVTGAEVTAMEVRAVGMKEADIDMLMA